ncbi:hypothetical protein B0H10DRAFT_2226052 [Mycena sp. CBHHK59/15]|nr:hypothetical protein B0H10DRAFT_2226052 [Mycena sp. CBHHK59/15]
MWRELTEKPGVRGTEKNVDFVSPEPWTNSVGRHIVPAIFVAQVPWPFAAHSVHLCLTPIDNTKGYRQFIGSDKTKLSLGHVHRVEVRHIVAAQFGRETRPGSSSLEALSPHFARRPKEASHPSGSVSTPHLDHAFLAAANRLGRTKPRHNVGRATAGGVHAPIA